MRRARTLNKLSFRADRAFQTARETQGPYPTRMISVRGDILATTQGLTIHSSRGDMKKEDPITRYAKMWPRVLFDCKSGKHPVVRKLDILSQPGVYILYRDDQPYYVGKANKLLARLWPHANQSTGRYYKFWTHFSAFEVRDATLRGQLEGVLIAAMRTANGAKPRIKEEKLPPDVRRMVYKREALQMKVKE
jgi:hypothetical protein